MENIQMESNGSNKQTHKGAGVAYPTVSIEDSINAADQIVDKHGSGKPISKEDISKALNKKVNTLNLFFSTMVQYGIFNLVHGKGYIPSDLYRRYKNPIDETDPLKTRLLMFQNAPLYAKIIEQLNNHQLPTNEKMFANRIKEPPFNVSEHAANKASKIFFENVRGLGLLNGNNTLHFRQENQNVEHEVRKQQNEEKSLNHSLPKDDTLFQLPIPLPNKRIAYLNYPLDNLTQKDIHVIQKALEFIASSIDYSDES